MRAMHSDARWVQELYPVDEMLAPQACNLPLGEIRWNSSIRRRAAQPTRVHALRCGGQRDCRREFKVSTVMQPYNGVMTRYEDVEVETGWVRMETPAKPLLNERVKTDIEEFWDHYQNKTLPRVYQSIMSQAHGEIRAEYLPPFDSLTLDIHMSEPDYSLDLDKERISTLGSATGGHVLFHGEFHQHDRRSGNRAAHRVYGANYSHRSCRRKTAKTGTYILNSTAKAAANPLVRLTWTDASGSATAGRAQPSAHDWRVSTAPDSSARQSQRRQ